MYIIYIYTYIYIYIYIYIFYTTLDRVVIINLNLFKQFDN